MTAKMPPPDDDEDYSDFMDRCTLELDDDECQEIWDERAAKDVLRKTHLQEKVDGLEFIMSDETVDRMGDIILADGWKLDSFFENNVALFGHKSDFPIGNWTNVHVANKQLRGTLELAKKGTSPRIDEIISLVEQGVLRAVSVGFRPLDYEPIDKDKPYEGLRFKKQELVETSLVSVPANPKALAVAKSLDISPATLALVFAGKGKGNELRRRELTGGQADPKTAIRKGTTMSLAQRIKDAERQLVEKQDALKAFHEGKGEANYTDEDMENVAKANSEIAQGRKLLDVLKESERNMAAASDGGPARSIIASHAERANGTTSASSARPFNIAPKKIDPLTLFCRAGALSLLARCQAKSVYDVTRAYCGDDEAMKAVVDWQQKAASAAAMTTVTGWAAELVQQIVVDFMKR